MRSNHRVAGRYSQVREEVRAGQHRVDDCQLILITTQVTPVSILYQSNNNLGLILAEIYGLFSTISDYTVEKLFKATISYQIEFVEFKLRNCKGVRRAYKKKQFSQQQCILYKYNNVFS